jgi:hypothetical protein
VGYDDDQESPTNRSKIMMMILSHPLFIQHFEAYLTNINLSSQFEKQSFIVTAWNLDI